MDLISAEQLVGEELAQWYALTPWERWQESARLWEIYRSLGSSLEPEPDTQSPFFDGKASGSRPVDGRSGLHPVKHPRVYPPHQKRNDRSERQDY